MGAIGRWARELGRSRAVTRLRVLDTPPEPAFDRLVGDAASAFAAPIALLSITHGDNLWHKARIGYPLTANRRSDTFCRHLLDGPDLLEVCAPQHDPRFRDLPVVRAEEGVRYYIGAAVSDGHGRHVGALCVADVRPHQPASADQRAYLLALARRAGLALEGRLHALRDARS